MHILLFLLLLLPSLCFAGPTDSYVYLSGASIFRADNAAFEIGANKYMAVGARVQYTQSTPAQAYIFAKSVAGDNSWILYRDSVPNCNWSFLIDKAGDLSTVSLIQSPNGYANDTQIHTMTGQYISNGVGTSGITLWVDGNRIGTVSNSNSDTLKDSAAPITIGSSSDSGTWNTTGLRVYQIWQVFFDDPALALTDQKVTDWTTNPSILPFSGVSRAFVWGPDGTYFWKSGGWVDSGRVNASYSSSTVVAGASIWGASVTGSAFLIDSTADGSQFDRGKFGMVTLTDSAGKTAVGYLGNRGSGASTFVANILTGLTNYVGAAYETFTVSGVSVSPAINTAGYGVAYSNKFGFLSAGRLWLYEFDLTLTSGTAPNTYVGKSDIVSESGLTLGQSSPGGNTRFWTTLGTESYACFQTGSGIATNFNITALAVKNVLTPGSTGVSVYSSPTQIGVEAYSGWTAQSGFNWNAIVSYTITGYSLVGAGFDLDFTGNPTATRWKPTNFMDWEMRPFPRHWEVFPIP